MKLSYILAGAVLALGLAAPAKAVPLADGSASLFLSLTDTTGTDDGIDDGDVVEVTIISAILQDGAFAGLTSSGSFTIDAVGGGNVAPISIAVDSFGFGAGTLTLQSTIANAPVQPGDPDSFYQLELLFLLTDDVGADYMSSFVSFSLTTVWANDSDSAGGAAAIATPAAFGIPLPAPAALLLTGLIGLAAVRRRKKA